jgi:hypothetical protein
LDDVVQDGPCPDEPGVSESDGHAREDGYDRIDVFAQVHFLVHDAGGCQHGNQEKNGTKSSFHVVSLLEQGKYTVSP